MNEQMKEKVLHQYDEELQTLRSIDDLNINKTDYNKKIIQLSRQDILSFATGKITKINEELIGRILTKCGTNANTNDLLAIKNYIDYPDFTVKTNIKNPCDIYNVPNSIEQSLTITPIYELNFILPNNSNDTLKVILIRKMEIIPGINRIYIKLALIDKKEFDSICKNIMINYIMSTKKNINDDENKYLKSIAISKLVKEHNILDNNYDYFFDTEAFNNYSYQEFTTLLKLKYGIIFNESFITNTGEKKNIWILSNYYQFDNRPIVEINDKKVTLSLELQKKLHERN